MEHFLHWHPLRFYELDPEALPSIYANYCKGCCTLISGSAYGCSTCRFYLHKSCAELPRETQNFFHPCPLLLDSLEYGYSCNACSKAGFGFSYRCKGCEFYMHVECARRPTLKSQMDEELVQHFTHWHPLKLVDPNEHIDVGCSICEKICSGSDSSTYCCKDCNFFIHKSCMINIPQQISHFFHPSCPLILRTDVRYKCKGCDEAGSGFAFRCGKCSFELDVKCALLPTVDTKDADMIQHCAHNHPLVLQESKELSSEIRCKVCREDCLLDSYFGCCKRSCMFFLHRKCAVKLLQEKRHLFHPRHPLVLISNSPYRCKVCDEEGSDLAYGCTNCKFQLDVKCALFPTIESKDADKILHCSHKHPLTLCESKEFGDEVQCKACAKSCLETCFGCTECNFFLHKTCAVELREKDICHSFHPLHPLTLSSSPPLTHHDTFQCSSCLGSVSDDRNLLRYHCAKCGFDLHIDCAKPKLTIPVGHEHGLTYFDKTVIRVQCSICHEDAQSSFFRCVACAFNIHIYCIPSTPKTIQHQRHLHPLTVTKSPFEYELISPEYADGSDDEFYCDICEEKRYKLESVYCCADCKFIAEVPCVLSELLPFLIISKDQSCVESTIVSRDEKNSTIEATIANLDTKIAKSKQKRRELKKRIEYHRGILKSLEEELERRNYKLRKLRTDRFFAPVSTSVVNTGLGQLQPVEPVELEPAGQAVQPVT
ncbi:hypothetical protein GQ457_08G026420 [Hibiscus cannabinus]